MLRLYKANMARLANLYFTGGCIIALTVTYAVTENIIMFPFLAEVGSARRMFFISAAMIAFFTIFIPVFVNAEYTDGTIRNKMIMGHSQRTIFLSLYLSYASLAAVMWLCYIIGGMAGGASALGEYAAENIVMLISLLAYIAVILMFSFRIRNTVAVVVMAGVLFFLSTNMVLFGNLFLMLASRSGNKTAEYVMSLIYNVNTLGQWFSLSGFADDCANPGNAVQILISLTIITLMLLAGIKSLKKRDVV